MATVLVTGASGFLGLHVTQRLLDRGDTVRALVRSRDRLTQHLAELGVDGRDGRVEAVEGDMGDAPVVRAAAEGCELAVHAAAIYSYRRRDAARMREQNAAGVATVLDAAIAQGARCVVHVSSTGALLRRGAVLDHNSPLGDVIGPYTESKVESERVARDRQGDGAPVAIVNPGAIVGPHDPYLGVSNQTVANAVAGRVPIFPRGRLQWVDVRDTAAVVVAALDHPGRRFMVPGETLPSPHGTLAAVTGRRLPVLRLPFRALAPLLHLGYRTDLPFVPHELEGSRFIDFGVSVDASATLDVLGVKSRPLTDSLRDTVRWLVEAGHVPARHAGAALAA